MYPSRSSFIAVGNDEAKNLLFDPFLAIESVIAKPSKLVNFLIVWVILELFQIKS